MANGTYSVWFKSVQGEGTGIVELADGLINGRDTMVTYEGRYDEDGDRFTATISTRRHSPGHLPLFQIDELDIDLAGLSSGPRAHAAGRVRQMPGVNLEVILIPIVD